MLHKGKISAPALEFRFASPVYIVANQHYEPHTHLHNEMVIVQLGRFRSHVNNCEYMATPGDILFYRTGLVHEEWAEDGLPVQTWVCAFRGGDLDKNEPVFRRDVHGRVQDMVAQLAAEQYLHLPKTEDRSFGLPLLQVVLAEFTRLNAHRPQAMVEQVRAFMRDHLSQPFTLDDLAAIAGLSKGHFARHYRTLTGRTPMEDARLVRVEEARRLILGTTQTLSDIAPQVGIANECQLSRLVKSVLGVSVRELKRAGK